jgi:hypothetical protein
LADTKITGLTAVSAAAATNTLPVVEDPGGTPVTKKATLAQVAALLISDTAYDATSWNAVTDVAPSKNAVRDKIEALAFSDLDSVIAATQLGAAAGYAGIINVQSASIDFNDDNSDTAINIALPTGFTRYLVSTVRLYGASASLTTATFGVFTATGAGGTAIVATGTACTISSAADGGANSAQNCTVVGANTVQWAIATTPTLYFRVQTAQGSPATGRVVISVFPLP